MEFTLPKIADIWFSRSDLKEIAMAVVHLPPGGRSDRPHVETILNRASEGFGDNEDVMIKPIRLRRGSIKAIVNVLNQSYPKNAALIEKMSGLLNRFGIV